MKAEIVVTLPQAKNTRGGQPTPEARRWNETDSPLQPSGGTDPAHTLVSDFQPSLWWDSKFLLFELPHL